MQESVSSGITILRLWKRLLELTKIPLHSKPGAKSDPAKRGRFLTNGCYTTAEILFSATTLYQLPMFLHFKHLSLSGSSLHNTGTKSAERIVNFRGKPTRFSSLTPSLLSQTCLIKAQECNLTSMPSSVWLKLVPK